ncbi:hypothetical protein ABIE44_002567 [Marmoricola sp. OAE513]|uniref:hypothetical protein n=1 Tax=Marmoricola sp. OAE513 TaxID=2817894 RepID=UPI001AE51E5D
MPWSPSFEGAVPDPRLDPYRGRAARLSRDGVASGHVLVETDYLADRLSGWLWWRRWQDPTEFPVVMTKLDDGSFDSDDWVRPERIDALLATWAAGRDEVQGTTYEITWLDQQESDRVHHEVFGHQH